MRPGDHISCTLWDILIQQYMSNGNAPTLQRVCSCEENCRRTYTDWTAVSPETTETGVADLFYTVLFNGADVNFIEDEACCNAWRTPVLHDAINCAVMSCRWNKDDKYMGFREFSTKEKSVEALGVLKKMLDMGADVKALDSYGNSGLNRFALQAKQILPSYNYVEHREGKDRIFTEELHEDLRSVLQALKDAGADDSYKAPNLGYSVREFCSEGSISILFDEVFG